MSPASAVPCSSEPAAFGRRWWRTPRSPWRRCGRRTRRRCSGACACRRCSTADVAAAADALVRLSWLAADLGERLVELDLNPLLLRAAGGGAVVVDARATLL